MQIINRSNSIRVVNAIWALALIFVLACTPSATQDTPEFIDIEATVAAAVEAALPTVTPEPTTDIDATVSAAIEATTAAGIPTPTSVPTPTEAPATATSVPDTPTPKPTATATMVPHTPTSVPTNTPTPTVTPTVEPTLSLADISAIAEKAVVKIITDSGSGSGFFIAPGDLIVTAAHVVEGVEEVEFTLDGTSHQATVISRIFGQDIALLRSSIQISEYLGIGNVDDVRAGDIAVKSGFGASVSDQLSVASGVISSVFTDERYQAVILQNDVAINPGDSGSPLLNSNAEVIAVNTSKLVATAIEGVSYSASIKPVLVNMEHLLVNPHLCQPEPELLTKKGTVSKFGNSEYGYTSDQPYGWQWTTSEAWAALVEWPVPSVRDGVRGSKFRAYVSIYGPYVKGSYTDAADFIRDTYTLWTGDESFPAPINSVCLGNGKVGVETDLTLTWAGDSSDDIRDERWVSFISGGSVYLLIGSVWTGHFDDFQVKMDTVLYTFEP